MSAWGSAATELADFRRIDEWLVEQALAHAVDTPEPKVVMGPDEYETDEGLQLLSIVASDLIGHPLNTIVFRRWQPDDESLSRAHTFHKESDRYVGRMALLTLSGESVLELARGKDLVYERHAMYFGRLLIIGTNTSHRILPPRENEIHRLVFLGYDTTTPLATEQ